MCMNCLDAKNIRKNLHCNCSSCPEGDKKSGEFHCEQCLHDGNHFRSDIIADMYSDPEYEREMIEGRIRANDEDDY